MKLEFYEKVVVCTSGKFPDLVGALGFVFGISQDEEQIYGYSVYIPDLEECYSFGPNDLVGTGEIAKRSDFYDENDIIRVRVEKGEGSTG